MPIWNMEALRLILHVASLVIMCRDAASLCTFPSLLCRSCHLESISFCTEPLSEVLRNISLDIPADA